MTLQDLPTDIVMLATLQLVSKSKWLPTVAKLHAACREMHYAALTLDTAINMMVAARMPVTPEQQREHELLEPKRRYIAKAAKHLRNGDTSGLTVTHLLVNPALEGIGTEQPSFLLQCGESNELYTVMMKLLQSERYARISA